MPSVTGDILQMRARRKKLKKKKKKKKTLEGQSTKNEEPE